MHSSDGGAFASIIPTKVRSRLTSSPAMHGRRCRTAACTHVAVSFFAGGIAGVMHREAGNARGRGGLNRDDVPIERERNDGKFFLYPIGSHAPRYILPCRGRVTFYIILCHPRSRETRHCVIEKRKKKYERHLR